MTMSQDALLLAAICDELSDLLVGGRVQRVVRPSELSIGIEVYAGSRYQLLLDAEADSAKVALCEERLRRGAENASPLQLLLRKYVEGARLTGISQPGLERVLRFSFTGAEGSVELVCEVMGRLSNLLLLDQAGLILDSAKRVPARINRYRTVLPGHRYVPPPPQNKIACATLDLAALNQALEAQSGQVPRRLVSAIEGMSPLLAREACFRSTGNAEARWPLDDAELVRLLAEMKGLLSLAEMHEWAPSIGYQHCSDARYAVAIAPYPLTHCDSWEPVASVSAAAATPLSAVRPRDAYAGARAGIRALIDGQVKRFSRRVASLKRAAAEPEELADLQFRGEAILALAWSIQPGQEELVFRRGDVTGEEGASGDEELRLTLDPTLSPAANAQAAFQAYRKRQSAGERIPTLLDEARRELAYLEQLQNDLSLAQDRPGLEAVRAALQEAGYLRAAASRVQPRAAAPLELRGPNGALVLAGRNSAQNEIVTFRMSEPRDLWLHARGVSGGHVIVRSGTDALNERDLLFAASVAAYYSRLRDEATVAVDFTERRHVRRMPGGRPGMVTYRNERTLTVQPRDPSLQGEEG